MPAITAALVAASTSKPDKPMPAGGRLLAELDRDLAVTKQRIAELEQENRDLVGRLEQIVALAFGPFGTAEPAKAPPSPPPAA